MITLLATILLDSSDENNKEEMGEPRSVQSDKKNEDGVLDEKKSAARRPFGGPRSIRKYDIKCT